jgi:hypothetical protein
VAGFFVDDASSTSFVTVFQLRAVPQWFNARYGGKLRSAHAVGEKDEQLTAL